MQRGFTSFSVIIILLIVTLVGAGAYYLGKSNSSQPTLYPAPSSTPSLPVDKNISDEITSWKTYTNSKGQYLIRYPNSWAVEQGASLRQEVTDTKFTSPDYIVDKPEMGGGYISGSRSGSILTIQTEVNPNFKSFEEYKNFQENVSTGWSSLKYDKTMEIKLDGKMAILQVGAEPSYRGQIYYCYSFNNGRIYELVLTSADNQEKLFNDILSTFKFTSP